MDSTQLSKFLSFVLRHNPDAIGITLDSHGWVSIDELLAKSKSAGTRFTREELYYVVESSDKKRFTLSTDSQKIRAAQGHSLSVDLGLTPKEPPSVLYHGTASQSIGSILSEGLKPKSRQQVHLSTDEATARRVGERHGQPVVLRVDARSMYAQGYKFVQADNGVWLTDCVPSEFLISMRSDAAEE